MQQIKKLTRPFSLFSLLSLLTSLALAPASLADDPVRFRPAGTVNLAFQESTSMKKVYLAAGEAAGVTVLFDAGLRDREITFTAQELDAEKAFRMLAETSGNFHKALDETTILVAADTPQNRRNYEELVIRTYFLENSDIKSIMTSLRSLVEAKKISANQDQRTVTVRDTAAKMALITRLVEILDRNPAETQVDVAVLAVPQTLLRGLKSESEGIRLSTEDLAGLRAAGGVTVLAEPSVSILAEGRATLALKDAVPVRIPDADRGSDDAAGYTHVNVGLELELRALVHPETHEVSLEAKLNMDSMIPAADHSLPTQSRRRFESGMRLKEGQSYLITGLMEVSPGSPGLFGGEGTRKGQQVVVALTPRIVREPGLTEADLEDLWVGTETWIEYQGEGAGAENTTRFAGNPQDLEEVRQRLRERLAKLPRGLQAAQEEEAEE